MAFHWVHLVVFAFFPRLVVSGGRKPLKVIKPPPPSAPPAAPPRLLFPFPILFTPCFVFLVFFFSFSSVVSFVSRGPPPPGPRPAPSPPATAAPLRRRGRNFLFTSDGVARARGLTEGRSRAGWGGSVGGGGRVTRVSHFRSRWPPPSNKGSARADHVVLLRVAVGRVLVGNNCQRRNGCRRRRRCATMAP